MTGYTYDEDIYSDLYKETFGMRPRGDEFYSATPERKQQIWDTLMLMHAQAMEEHRAMQERGAKEFELAVTKSIMCGAKDRETAIRWMVEALPEWVYHDHLGYLEYEYDLPYGYLREYRPIQEHAEAAAQLAYQQESMQ